MSVWEDVESLKSYVYGSAHREVLRRRSDRFTRFEGAYAALWWIPVGHVPSVAEAKERLARLAVRGPSAHAFTLKHALVLGLLGMAAAVAGVVVNWNLGLGPRWYPISLVFLAMPQSWAGGHLFERQVGREKQPS